MRCTVQCMYFDNNNDVWQQVVHSIRDFLFSLYYIILLLFIQCSAVQINTYSIDSQCNHTANSFVDIVTYTYIKEYICMYVYICIYVCMYIYVYTYQSVCAYVFVNALHIYSVFIVFNGYDVQSTCTVYYMYKHYNQDLYVLNYIQYILNNNNNNNIYYIVYILHSINCQL